jgi:hypothetical protein
MRTAVAHVFWFTLVFLAGCVAGAIALFVVAAVASAAEPAPPAPALDPELCAPRQAIVNVLAKHLGQSPAWHGTAHVGDLLEVFQSKRGTWTVVLTDVHGRSCVIGGGTDATFTLPPTGDPS